MKVSNVFLLDKPFHSAADRAVVPRPSVKAWVKSWVNRVKELQKSVGPLLAGHGWMANMPCASEYSI